MKRFVLIPLLPLALILMAFLIAPHLAAAESPAPEEVAKARKILDEIDDLYRGDSSEGVMEMQVKTQHYERTMKMRGWSLGEDYSLTRVLEPKKERGLATLKAGNDIFNYLPKTDRTIKITSGMMMGSWMGSHFTNDDIVKESRMSEDYDPVISFEGERGGVDVWEFTLHPRPEAAVVWGKVVITVRKSDRMPLDAVYYDEDGEEARTMTFGEYQKMDGRLVPASMKIVPADKPGEYTLVRYLEMDFDVNLSKSYFTVQNLKR